MKRTHTYYKTAAALVGIDLSDAAASVMYELARIVAKKQGKVNLSDITRIKTENKPVEQWSNGNHAENHMI